MEACYIIHYHEIGLKLGNREWFEKLFIRNVKRSLKGLPFSGIKLKGFRVFVFGIDTGLKAEYERRFRSVMGLQNAILMFETIAEMEQMKTTLLPILEHTSFENFRVTTKRQNKAFPLNSTEINRELGAAVVERYKKRVQLKNAELEVLVEVVGKKAYIGFEKLQGFGGLPVGSGERAVCLLSSGIDSPVAAFEMLKRGVDLVYVHFHSVPSTSRQSLRNVEEILKVLSRAQGKSRLFHVPLLALQQKIMSIVPNAFWVIFFRRAMMRLANRIAENTAAVALLTGENIGQVASQTLSNIRAADDASHLPIIRPLAGHNKEDIITRAKTIGTYNISIEPYQDCCSFFVPRHPETKADLAEVHRLEADIDSTELLEMAIQNAEEKIIEADWTWYEDIPDPVRVAVQKMKT